MHTLKVYTLPTNIDRRQKLYRYTIQTVSGTDLKLICRGGPILVCSMTHSMQFENTNVHYEFKKRVVINMFIMAYAVFFEIIIFSHKLKIIISGLDRDNLAYVI